MKKSIEYLILAFMTVALCFVIFIQQVGMEKYINNLIFNSLYIWFVFIFSYFVSYIVNSLLFILLGKIKGLNIAAANLCPYFLLNGKLNHTINLNKLCRVVNAYDISDLDFDDMELYLMKKRKIMNMLNGILLLISLFFLIVGFIWSIFILKVIFFTNVIRYIFSMFFDKEVTTNKEFLFYDVLFSNTVSEAFFLYHFEFLFNNLIRYTTDAEMLCHINTLLFSLENVQFEREKYIYKMHVAVLTLLEENHKDLSIPCSGLIFEYIDNSICLKGIDEKEAKILKTILDCFMDVEWSIYSLPSPYYKRYFQLMKSLESGKRVGIIKGYSIYCKN